MPKVIHQEVGCCSSCPACIQFDVDGEESWCNVADMGIDDDSTIPDFCPLEDAPGGGDVPD